MKTKPNSCILVMVAMVLSGLCFFGVPAGLFAEEPAARNIADFEALKKEWEEVREQQIRMIREKEEQLEKLKEELFAKMKAAESPAKEPILPVDNSGGAVLNDKKELGQQKAAFLEERQKFFTEMNRQKEKLRQDQAALDQKVKQLEEERARFEKEKQVAAH
ncbi:MAG TPA: hypothetical protein PLL75_04715 [Candidatus Omnitrophota bacterium]|nr:hypothetical protein [Candidatus Omnitrophota bacterium]HPS37013.1 hypothetical protein [Candidatus Omnitrophota bacterium]